MSLDSNAKKIISKAVALLIAIVVGAVTLLAILYMMPEIESVIAEVGEVDIPGFELLTNLGTILLVLGALIGILVVIFMSVVESVN